MSTAWRVSITEKRYVDWVVEVEAATQEEAETIALAVYQEKGSEGDIGEVHAEIDWIEEVT